MAAFPQTGPVNFDMAALQGQLGPQSHLLSGGPPMMQMGSMPPPGMPPLPSFPPNLQGLPGMPGMSAPGPSNGGMTSFLSLQHQTQQVQQQQHQLQQQLRDLQRQQGDAIGSNAPRMGLPTPAPPPSGMGASGSAPPHSSSGAGHSPGQGAQVVQPRRQPPTPPPPEVSQCHLHKKASKNCKFCQRYREAQAKKEEHKANVRQAIGRRLAAGGGGLRDDNNKGPLEVSKDFGLSPVLHQHIAGSAHYKELLTFETLQQVVGEVYQYADSAEPYAVNSSTTPSALFCCLYRLFALGIDGNDLVNLMSDMNSYVRIMAILFVRFGLPPDQLWPWLGEYTLDDEEIFLSKNEGTKTTIGEVVEELLSSDKYFSVVLPRLPMSVKRQLQEKLAPISQYRKRALANREHLDTYRGGNLRVEANINGEWIRGRALDLLEDAPSRIKVVVKLENDIEEVVHIGRVIMSDGSRGGGKRGRSRSRSRGRGGHVDWARDKGRPDKELIDELRTKDRERAVCSSGKDYAKKPLGYKAACAMPSEMGAASAKLIEEDTFVAARLGGRRSDRSPSPNSQNFKKGPSAEHQAQMQKVFEKYGISKGAGGEGSRRDTEGPDFMRLG